MEQLQLMFGAVSALLLVHGSASALIIETYDNFNCFNDTDQETEGFEIDIEDINCGDNTESSAAYNLTRVFPSNFGGSLWVIRYGLPTISHYDFTIATADAAHAYDQGHKGVLVTYAAAWNGSSWIASQGNAVGQGAPGVAGNGTPHNLKPTLTAGDSCWWYGLGATYPTSGCDHFGISFTTGVSPGKVAYHWKVPDPANPGHLINWAAEASIPPSPTFHYAGAGNPAVAVAEAPENEGPQWGPAYFIKTTTLYQPQAPNLAGLQKVNITNIATKKYLAYSVPQRPPAGVVGEKEDVEDNNVPKGNVDVTTKYEYWTYAGLPDDTGQALCDDAFNSIANYNAGNPIASGTSCSIGGSYYAADINGTLVHVKSNKGQYLGAHVNAVQVK